MVNMAGLTKLEMLTYWISKPAQDISPSTIVKIEKQKSCLWIGFLGSQIEHHFFTWITSKQALSTRQFLRRRYQCFSG